MKRLLTPIFLFLLTAAPALACPLCNDSVPSSDAQAAGGLPSGFNNSIYLMLGGFFCVLGFVTFTIVKGTRVPTTTKNAFPIVTKNQD
jgi:hypothetical protein